MQSCNVPDRMVLLMSFVNILSMHVLLQPGLECVEVEMVGKKPALSVTSSRSVTVLLRECRFILKSPSICTVLLGRVLIISESSDNASFTFPLGGR